MLFKYNTNRSRYISRNSGACILTRIMYPTCGVLSPKKLYVIHVLLRLYLLCQVVTPTPRSYLPAMWTIAGVCVNGGPVFPVGSAWLNCKLCTTFRILSSHIKQYDHPSCWYLSSNFGIHDIISNIHFVKDLGSHSIDTNITFVKGA